MVEVVAVEAATNVASQVAINRDRCMNDDDETLSLTLSCAFVFFFLFSFFDFICFCFFLSWWGMF